MLHIVRNERRWPGLPLALYLSLTHSPRTHLSLAGGGATAYGTHMNIACRGTAEDTHECTHTHGRTDKSDTHSSASLCAQ